MQTNKWYMLFGDINWIDYGAIYGKKIVNNRFVIAEFINMHEYDLTFKYKYMLNIYEMSKQDITEDRNLKQALSFVDLELTDDLDSSICNAFSALVAYGGLSRDGYVGNNASKLFKQAGIKQFN